MAVWGYNSTSLSFRGTGLCSAGIWPSSAVISVQYDRRSTPNLPTRSRAATLWHLHKRRRGTNDEVPIDYNSSWSGAKNVNLNINAVKYQDNLVHTQTRRFVVVRAKKEFCYACPIFTYGGQATTKRGVRVAEHGIAFSVGQDPELVSGKTGITKPSLGVKDGSRRAPSRESVANLFWNPSSYPVQCQGEGIGHVLSEPTLIGNWMEEEDRDIATKQSPAFTAATANSISEFAEVPEEKPNDGNAPMSKSDFKKAVTVVDPYLYHATNSEHGYDASLAPHIYPPTYNPYEYHHEHNAQGYHPTPAHTAITQRTTLTDGIIKKRLTAIIRTGTRWAIMPRNILKASILSSTSTFITSKTTSLDTIPRITHMDIIHPSTLTVITTCTTQMDIIRTFRRTSTTRTGILSWWMGARRKFVRARSLYEENA
ncbi:hypothetical protein EK21DRAFT_88500 [Setomelanomma holmii]|uniref:DUF6590 domain-containing protein n=1 Tax=Setomelanomma holmii TaxID=210430 RepID=A0A9P4LNS0_9PLEO|nr:hypothetical protein EK21DRAFT_88500 [Setomelanomma holmii]